jgi:Ca2+-binding EF-hand superfamily protein
MMKYFSFDAESDWSMTLEDLIALVLSVYFVEIVFKRKCGPNTKWSSSKISLADFIELFTEYTYFIRVRPSREDLEAIFKELDTD